uniref:Secreted protein n=1 Tax=Dicentrarchus labrax TaxID=13489 RepID=A0A8C4IGN7_DICLA
TFYGVLLLVVHQGNLIACLLATPALRCQSAAAKGNVHSEALSLETFSTNMSKNSFILFRKMGKYPQQPQLCSLFYPKGSTLRVKYGQCH